MLQLRLAVAFTALAACLWAAAPASAAEEKRTCSMGREYYLYTPDDLDKAKTYWLVVGVHGAKGNGKGAGGLAGWVKKGNVIVVGPSFPDGYQVLMHDTDRQLLGIFQSLQKEFRLYPKLFIAGFSGGSQFAHRFALKNPEATIGCAAHSGGSWTDSLNPKALAVPFAISCGEKDTAKSTPDSPLARYEWCQKFARKMDTSGFYFKVRFWPDVAHRGCPGSSRMTEDCFNLSTTGMYDDERAAVQKEIDAIKPFIDAGQYGQAMQAIRNLSPAKAPLAARPKVGPTSGKAAPTVPPKPSQPKADEAKPAAPDGGSLLPGLQENKYGWRENAQCRAALEMMRLSYIEEQTKALATAIEKAGLEKVAAIESQRPAGAVAMLETLQKEIAGQKAVTAAIAKALIKVKKPAAEK